jgi:aldose 1-epimerase
MISRSLFGEVDGAPVHAYSVTTDGGIRATLIDFGARLVELHVPDRAGVFADIVLGFDDLPSYVASDAYFGATCGRYGNRIARGRFDLHGQPFQLDCNDGRNHQHGGTEGFDRKVWTASFDPAGTAVRFVTTSADGEMGYPGALEVSSTYEFGPSQVRVMMECRTDTPTIVNLVHHSYFNLAGHASGDVLGHAVTLDADFYTPVDDELLPTGEILSVAGTPFDFRHGELIGSRIGAVPSHDDSNPGEERGYDHNWVLRDAPGELIDVAAVHDPASGRVMRLRSTEPGVQLYTAGDLSTDVIGKGGVPYVKYAGVALETQKFPCSPNFSHFPATELRPGETYCHRMIFDFSTDADWAAS